MYFLVCLLLVSLSFFSSPVYVLFSSFFIIYKFHYVCLRIIIISLFPSSPKPKPLHRPLPQDNAPLRRASPPPRSQTPPLQFHPTRPSLPPPLVTWPQRLTRLRIAQLHQAHRTAPRRANTRSRSLNRRHLSTRLSMRLALQQAPPASVARLLLQLLPPR